MQRIGLVVDWTDEDADLGAVARALATELGEQDGVAKVTISGDGLACEKCDEQGGFEGEHLPAAYRLTVLRRPEYDGGEQTEAEVSILCVNHVVRETGYALEVRNGPHTLLVEQLAPFI